MSGACLNALFVFLFVCGPAAIECFVCLFVSKGGACLNALFVCLCQKAGDLDCLSIIFTFVMIQDTHWSTEGSMKYLSPLLGLLTLQSNGIVDGPFSPSVLECLRRFESMLVPAPVPVVVPTPAAVTRGSFAAPRAPAPVKQRMS